jgi:hypothetical protein
LQARKEKIKGKCFGCLNGGHQSKDCKRKVKCFHCKKEGHHHSSLCARKFGKANELSAAVVEQMGEVTLDTNREVNTTQMLPAGKIVLLQTATCVVQSPDGRRELNVRLVLDTASQHSYVSDKTARELQLKSRANESLNVNTFGSSQARHLDIALVELNLKLIDSTNMRLMTNEVPTITADVNRVPISNRSNNPLLQNLKLADTIPQKLEKAQIDFLVEGDYYFDIVTLEKITVRPNLFLIGSKLGWIVSGRMNELHASQHTSTYLTTFFVKTGIVQSNDLLNLESRNDVGIDQINAPPKTWKFGDSVVESESTTQSFEDKLALENFEKTVEYKNERYYVSWPWKGDEFVLKSNYMLVLGKLNSLLRRLKCNDNMSQEYQKNINEQLKSGIIEVVNNSDLSASKGPVHYLPHHGVITAGKKLRIVYDASAKINSSSHSLNQCLYRGPVLLVELIGLLIRFRLNDVAIVADLEKAFLQVGLQDQDRDVTRFLWLKDCDNLSTENNIQVLRFTRVPFFIISSPFVLMATISHHLDGQGTEYAMKIKRDMYVDNLVTGVNNEQEAVTLYKNAKQLFVSAFMNLRDWTTNSTVLTESISDADKGKSVCKVLGMQWDSKADVLSLCPISHNDNQMFTKRNVLKMVASVFDPMGLFSPVILKARLYFQSLCDKQLQWDEQLSDKLAAEWREILSDLREIANHSFQCLIGGKEIVTGEKELHCYCDALLSGYGICVYLKVINGDKTKCELLFAKSRVTSSKRALTIPCLELLAVCLGIKYLTFVSAVLLFDVKKRVIWSDSMCVLHWIQSRKQLPVFVKNHIQQISEHRDISFCYISIANNPADLASQGSSTSLLANNYLWWHGPQMPKEATGVDIMLSRGEQ